MSHSRNKTFKLWNKALQVDTFVLKSGNKKNTNTLLKTEQNLQIDTFVLKSGTKFS